MKHRLLFLISLVCAVTLASCKGDEPSVDLPKQTRTVIVYMVAENSLSSYSTYDLNEMKKAVEAGALGNSRLLYYLDTYGAQPVLAEFMSDGERHIIKTYSTDETAVMATRMCEVLDDATKYAPATAYGLVLWGHGTGWLQDGIVPNPLPAPLSYGGEKNRYWMNITTLADVLARYNFDWLYFDCCYMASVETVFQLRNVTKQIVACPTEIPAAGAPYDKILPCLLPYNSNLKGACLETFSYYDNLSGEDRTCTISLINTSGLDELAMRFKEYYTTYAPGLPAVSGVQRYTLDYPCPYFDLEDYASHLLNAHGSTNEQLAMFSGISTALGNVVEFNMATPYLWDIIPLTNHCGLSTFIVENASDATYKNYDQLEWWHEVVEPCFKQ